MKRKPAAAVAAFPVLAVAVALAVAATSAMSSCAPAATQSRPAKADKKPTFVMVTKAVHPYYEPCYEGFKAADDEYGVKAERADPQKMRLSMQVQVIEDLIARRVDGMAISALDDAGLVPVIADAMKAGIKVITFDAPAPSSEALTFIGTDNKAAGFEAGKRIAALLEGKGTLVILQGGLGASNLNLRTEGFKEAIAEHGPGIQVLDVVDTAGDFSVATNKTETVLQRYPDLTALFSVSAEGAPAAASVLRHQDKAGKVVLAGFDDLKVTLEGIKDGSIAFCLVQNTFKMGWMSVEALLDASKGKTLPKATDTGVIFVTKSNVGNYMEQMKKDIARK